MAAALTVVLAGTALAPPHAHAATFTVNSTADAVDASPGNGICATSGGTCTLRAAIMEANASVGSDTITLPAGTYLLTLGPRDDEQTGTNNNDAAGDLDVLHFVAGTNNDLVINGAGSASTIINGNSIDRVLDVDPTQFSPGGDAHGLDVTLSNLTITGGRTLENVDANAGTGNAFADGAGIRFDGFHDTDRGSLTLTNVVITGNTADHNGGGLYLSYGDLAVTGSTISNNTAEAGEGGGMWVANSPGHTTTISNSTISGNKALRDVYLPGLTTDVVGGDGGGLSANVGASITITNSSFSNNVAERHGGGIDVNTRTVSMSGTTISGNKAGDHAGGVYLDPDTSGFPTASATLSSLIVQSNTADATVPGVVTSDGTGTGGGIYHRGGKLTLTGSAIGGSGVGNSAAHGGGLAFDNDPGEVTAATSDVRKNQILANAASATGGGVWVGAGTFTARYNRVRGNTAPTGRGLRRSAGTVDATDNWWGCNSDPTAGGAGCDTVSNVPAAGVNPRLALTNTSSPNPIRVTESTTFTASVLKNSAGTSIPLADLTVLLNLPLTFGGATLGTLSGESTTVGPDGTASAVYTAGATGGPGNVDVTVDSAVAPGNIEVHEPPTITVPADQSETEDSPGSKIATVPFTVTATGYPQPVGITCAIEGTQIAAGDAPLAASHGFPQGLSTVDCTASNGVSPDSTDSFTVTVNTAPVLTVPADITVTEDVPNGNAASVTFQASSDSYPNATITCDVAGTVIGAGPTPLSVTHTFGAGTSAVSCTAANGIDPPATETFTVTVQTLPVLTVPADIEVTEDPADSGSASVAWTTSATGVPTPTISCELGNTVITSPHTFAVGDQVVTCTATNSVGSDVESFHVVVAPANDPPVAVPGGPYAVAEGSTVTLDASGSSDPDDDALSFAWDLDNDGTYETSGVVATFAGDDGPVTKLVGLKVTDAGGAVGTATTAVHVSNVAPTGQLGNGGGIPEGSIGSVGFTDVSDPSPADESAGFSYSWDFDNDGTFEVVDSSSATASVPASYLHDGPATATVRGRISDDDGGFTDYTTAIVVHNVAPTAELANSGPVPEHSPAGVAFGPVTDPSPTDHAAGFTYSWDLDNDGTWDVVDSTASSATVPAAVLDDGGDHVVRGRVVDKDGGFTEYATTITVTDVAPTATLAGGGTVPEGSTATVSFTDQTDPSTADTAAGFRYSWDFDNDGTLDLTDEHDPTATVPASYLADGPATRTVRGRIADKDGSSSDYTVVLTITNVAPAVSMTGSPDAQAGATYAAQLAASDPSPVDEAAEFTYSVSWGDGSPTETIVGPADLPVQHVYADLGDYTVTVTVTDKDGATSETFTWPVSVTGVRIVDDSCMPGTTLVVRAGSGDDVLEIRRTADGMQVLLNQQSLGVFNPSARLILSGGAGADRIEIDERVALDQLVYGGDGNDRTISGNGMLTFVGGDGDDVVSGGNGRDILIGGRGADTLGGDNGEDILVSGVTAYDAGTAAGQASLCMLAREWNRADAPYTTRHEHLRGVTTGGLNGTDVLLGPGPGQTVFDDGSSDMLSGGNGSDWFLLNRSGPGVLDVADIAPFEFGSDL